MIRFKRPLAFSRQYAMWSDARNLAWISPVWGIRNSFPQKRHFTVYGDRSVTLSRRKGAPPSFFPGMKPKEWAGIRSFRFREERLKRRAILGLLLGPILGSSMGRADEDMVQVSPALLTLAMDVDTSMTRKNSQFLGCITGRFCVNLRARLPRDFEMNGPRNHSAPHFDEPGAGPVANRHGEALTGHG